MRTAIFRRLAFVCIGAAMFAPGCAGRIAQWNEEGRQTVETRAAFDFDCSSDEIEVLPLTTGASTTGRDRYHRDLVIEYGARGCGHRAVYVRLDNGQWLMNNDSHVHE